MRIPHSPALEFFLQWRELTGLPVVVFSQVANAVSVKGIYKQIPGCFNFLRKKLFFKTYWDQDLSPCLTVHPETFLLQLWLWLRPGLSYNCVRYPSEDSVACRGSALSPQVADSPSSFQVGARWPAMEEEEQNAVDIVGLFARDPFMASGWGLWPLCFLYIRASQLRHSWHWGQRILCCGAILCTVGCWAAWPPPTSLESWQPNVSSDIAKSSS